MGNSMNTIRECWVGVELDNFVKFIAKSPDAVSAAENDFMDFVRGYGGRKSDNVRGFNVPCQEYRAISPTTEQIASKYWKFINTPGAICWLSELECLVVSGINHRASSPTWLMQSNHTYYVSDSHDAAISRVNFANSSSRRWSLFGTIGDFLETR